jgi:sporulation integral membrane protein YlbJ
VRPQTADLLFGFFSLFCLLLLLRNANAALAFMTEGLTLCAKTVIPSLFPFAVLSELITSGDRFRRLLCRAVSPLGRLLGLGENGLCALLLGMLCGFPIGIRCAVRAYQSGTLSKNEAERVIAFSGTPSSAFLISTVGVSLFGDRRFGVMLYLIVLLSAVVSGFLLRLLDKKRGSEICRAPWTPQASYHPSVARRLTDAVSAAAQSMLLICAYVVFFSTLVGTLELIFTPLKLPREITAILSSVFEMSGGVKHAAALSSPRLARMIAAFAAGWSGLSVHCQALSFCADTDLSLQRYLPSKLLQGALAMTLVALLIG